MSAPPPAETQAPAETRRAAHERYAAGAGLGICDWPALGTTAQLLVTEPERLEVARHAVVQLLGEVDLAASRFRPDSELSRLNAAEGSWVAVSPLLVLALRTALDAAAWTDGLVDPTIGGALIDFGYDRTFASIPADGPAVTVRVGRVPGWSGVELDDDAGRVRLPSGTLLDLGATAKGLAADLCATAAAAASGSGVLVSLGGDISVAGDAPVGGWPVTVTDRSSLDLAPDGDDADAQVVVLQTGGLATSSTRARRWRRGGSVVHHLIDPRIGIPATGPWRTASVTAPSCALANAASTAAIILGDAAPGWLTSRQLHARLVAEDGAVTYVGAWPVAG